MWEFWKLCISKMNFHYFWIKRKKTTIFDFIWAFPLLSIDQKFLKFFFFILFNFPITISPPPILPSTSNQIYYLLPTTTITIPKLLTNIFKRLCLIQTVIKGRSRVHFMTGEGENITETINGNLLVFKDLGRLGS